MENQNPKLQDLVEGSNNTPITCNNNLDKASDIGLVDRRENFPKKLLIILSSERFKNIITFLDDGKHWKVINKKSLEEEVLPDYFRTSKYLSFTRNVLGWGFRRSGKATYYHDLFSKHEPHNVCQMQRISAAKIEFMKKQDAPRSSSNLSNSSNLATVRIQNNTHATPFKYTNQDRERSMNYLQLAENLHQQDRISRIHVGGPQTIPPQMNYALSREQAETLHIMRNMPRYPLNIQSEGRGHPYNSSMMNFVDHGPYGNYASSRSAYEDLFPTQLALDRIRRQMNM